MRQDRDFQVCISIDGPKNQLMQVSYSSYMEYWRNLGWKLENKAPELPNMPRLRREYGAQANFI